MVAMISKPLIHKGAVEGLEFVVGNGICNPTGGMDIEGGGWQMIVLVYRVRIIKKW